MRKKYLSALLFGALLVTSAGTFTSCKDYDDEINDLQEQVNTIKTDLESLKTTVEGLDGVKTLSYADGKLIIETGKGTKVEVPVPSATGVTEVKLEGNTLYVDGKEAGKVEIEEGQAIKVEVKEDGKLYINDEVQDLEIGSKVVMVDNGNGSYTMTVDGTSYVLPKYSPAANITSVVLGDVTTFGSGDATNSKICWGKAQTDQADWSVKRGQLLVGNINTIEVQVLPASIELDKCELSLENSLGEKAPVTVYATPNDKLLKYVTTRTTSKNGSWNLAIKMDESVTTDNIASVFDNIKGDNLMYALCVNGEPITAYDINIDVNQNQVNTGNVADLAGNFKGLTYIDSEGYIVEMPQAGGGILPLNSNGTDLSAIFNNSRLIHLYDSYITFEGTNKSLAESRGISAEGMKIKTTEASAGTKITATVYFLDLTGKESKQTIEFTVATSVADNVSADDVKYVVMPAKVTDDVAEVIKPIEIINLEKVFEGIDAATRQKIKNANQLSLVEEAGQTGFLAASDNSGVLLSGSKIGDYLYKADGESWVATGTTSTDDDLLDLATIKLPFEKDNNPLTLAKDAKPGKYVLYLVGVDESNTDTEANEIFRVKINVEIALPAFADLFSQVESNWSDDKFVARITPSGTTPSGKDANAVLTMSAAYGPVAGTNAETSRLSYLFSDDDCKYFSDLKSTANDDKLNAVINTTGIATFDKAKVYNTENTALNVTELKNIVAYTSVFAGLSSTKYNLEDNTADAIANIQEAFTVTSTPYNAVVKAALEGVKAVNYGTDKKARPANEPIQLTTEGYISPYAVTNGQVASAGFGFELDGTYVSAKHTGASNEFNSYSLLNKYALWDGGTRTNDYDVPVTTSAEQSNVTVEFVDTDNTDKKSYMYKVNNLGSGNSTTVTFTLTDQTGFKYPLTVTVQK